ncbi:hypothetical protein BLS_001487 [Venturia inaequalis]|uniref:2-dehydropantoate 2-reductase n=1 Tax=Venturia inaequalis TaxID=5025 RepID=A0A8H3YL69_VENIN|nr:hypothetical protein BLS_001487 [Venturia inaequalis]KAE9990672.1 hypothetical protein EG327_001067 [Venturia inaequalis]
MTTKKAKVLLIGSGGVGTMAAVNLEAGGLASVTAVLRSNFEKVNKDGFTIRSCDHGVLEGWKPSEVVNHIPKAAEQQIPYDFIVCTTKNIPDIPPALPIQVAPAITPGHTVIVLIQNGLNIEKPFFQILPNNIVLSGVSMIGSNELGHGNIEHEFPDELIVGAFRNPKLDPVAEDAAAKLFVELYSAAGKTACTYNENVGYVRWRKLIYNACLNPICAITNLDSGRIRLSDDSIEMLVRPAMEEIRAAAKAMGHDIPEETVDNTIEVDPLRLYLAPSMLADVRKGNFIEHENLVGEPLKEGLAKGVPMPTLKVLYALCKAFQWRTKEAKGIFVLPPKEEPSSAS